MLVLTFLSGGHIILQTHTFLSSNNLYSISPSGSIDILSHTFHHFEPIIINLSAV